MIIGLTGSNCSGKDTAADYLVEKKGFIHRSLSDVLRDEMRRKKIEITRDNLIVTGTVLRKRYGNAVLAKKALRGLDKRRDYVITSLRHPDEIKELKKIKGFKLINVTAPARLRFERMSKRRRAGDPLTFTEFVNAEKKELNTKGPGQQLGKCMEMADQTIVNRDSGLKKLYSKIDSCVKFVADFCC